MGNKPKNAFITTRKGFCYLTIKIGRSNFNLMRIRNYTIDAEEKRDLRRRYPDYCFDWKKIKQQLADKREVCRAYRSRRQSPRRTKRTPTPGIVTYDPATRTVYASDASTSDTLSLLDAILASERPAKK